MSDRKGDEDDEAGLPFVLTLGSEPPKSLSARPPTAAPNASGQQRRITPMMPWGLDVAAGNAARDSAAPDRPAAKTTPPRDLPRAAPLSRQKGFGAGDRHTEFSASVDRVGNVERISAAPPIARREGPASSSAAARGPSKAKEKPRVDDPYDIEVALQPHLGWLDDAGKLELLSYLGRGDHARALGMMNDARSRYPRIVSITKAQQVIERAATSRLQRRIGPFDAMPVLVSRPPVARDASKLFDVIDGKHTFDEVLQRVTISRLRALEIIDDLVRRGAIEVRVPESRKDAFPSDRGSDPAIEGRDARPRGTPVSLAAPSSLRKGAPLPRRDTPVPEPQRSSRPVPSDPRADLPARTRATPSERPGQRRPIVLPFDEDVDARVTLNDPDEVAAHVSLLKGQAAASERPDKRGETLPYGSDMIVRQLDRASEPPPPRKRDWLDDREEEPKRHRSDPPDVPALALTETPRAPVVSTPPAVTDDARPAAKMAVLAMQEILPHSEAPEVAEGPVRKIIPLRPAPVPDAADTSDTSDTSDSPAPPPVAEKPKAADKRVALVAVAKEESEPPVSPRVAVVRVEEERDAPTQGGSRVVVPVVILVMLGAVAAAAVLYFRTSGSPPNVASQAPAAPTTVAASVTSPTLGSLPPSASSNTATAVLTVDVTPRQAQVFLDQVLLTGQPIRVVLPRDGKNHDLRMEARGYLPRKTTFTASGDTNVILSLELAPSWTAAATAAPSQQPTAAPSEDIYGGP